MHLHRCEVGQYVGHLGEIGPIELHVLSGTEVSVASVVVARDVREHPQLSRRQGAIRDGNPKHWREALDVQAVAQTQVQEVCVRQRAVDVALRLVTKLRDSLVDKVLVEFVVAIHGSANRMADGRERYQDGRIERTNHCLYQ